MAKAMTKAQLTAKVAEKVSITKKAAAEILDFVAEAKHKEVTTRNNPVGWFEIYVQNIKRAKKFYESIFHVKLQRLNIPKIEIWAFPMEMDRVGAGGALIKMHGVPSGGNSTVVYFDCKDCAIEEKRVVKYGGRIHAKKLSIGEYGFISLVYDTEGNMFGLHSFR